MNEYDRPLGRIAKLQTLLEQEVLAHRAGQERCASVSRELRQLAAELCEKAMQQAPGSVVAAGPRPPNTTPSVLPDLPLHDSPQSDEVVAFRDGLAVSARRARSLVAKEFHVILDLCHVRLWVKAACTAAGMSKFDERAIQWLRKNRLALLMYMLSHPGVVVGSQKAARICNLGPDPMPINTLARTVCEFRRKLFPTGPDRPYIIIGKVCERIAGREEITGTGYMFNPDFRYLVLVKDFENHQRIIASVVAASS